MRNLLLLVFSLTLLLSCQNTENKSENHEEVISEKEADTTASSPKPAINTEELVKADHYICYTEDKDAKLVIWISFTEKDKALKIKYKGQDSTMDLVFDKEEVLTEGAYPTVITYYKEIAEGKENGTYKLTHSGNWDYVEYITGNASKKYNFTIDHEANPYGQTPCF